jgi:hypothetical protein
VEVVEEIFQTTRGTKLENVIPPAMKKKRVTPYKSPIQIIVTFFKSLLTVVTLPTGPYDTSTVFSKKQLPNQLVFPKRHSIHTFEPVPLDFIKKLKAAAGESVTINDVLFTVISQTIHDYLQEERDPTLTPELICRALLPVALPRPKTIDRAQTMRNLWCMVSCDLAVGSASVMDRLDTIHQTLLNLKNSYVPAVTMGLQTYVMKYFPEGFNRDQVLQIFGRHSLVFSNVPGPPEPVTFAGKEVQSVQMIHFNLIPQVGLLSYRGMVYGNMCLAADYDDNEHHTMPHRERLPFLLSKAYISLAAELNVKDVPESLKRHAENLN